MKHNKYFETNRFKRNLIIKYETFNVVIDFPQLHSEDILH